MKIIHPEQTVTIELSLDEAAKLKKVFGQFSLDKMAEHLHLSNERAKEYFAVTCAMYDLI